MSLGRTSGRVERLNLSQTQDTVGAMSVFSFDHVDIAQHVLLMSLFVICISMYVD